MKTFAFEVRSPEKIFFTGPVLQVCLKAADGELTILPDHAPLATILAPGNIRFLPEHAEEQTLSLSSGFLTVNHNRVSVLLV